MKRELQEDGSLFVCSKKLLTLSLLKVTLKRALKSNIINGINERKYYLILLIRKDLQYG